METTSMLFNKRLIAFNAKVNEKKFWTNKLAGRKELFFPTCYADELSDDSLIQVAQFELDAELHAKLSRICPEPGALFVMLATALCAQLNRFLDETSILLGTYIERQFEHEGSLAVVLPLVMDVEPSASFRDLLNTVKRSYLDAQANRDYPVEMLLKGLSGNNKMCNIGIILKNIHNPHLQQSEDAPELVFNFEQEADRISCSVAYNTSTYHTRDIDFIFSSFCLLLRNCLNAPDRSIKEMEVLSAKDKNDVLNIFNATQADYPADSSITAVFEEQVKLTPANVAVIYKDEQLTYAELNAKANALATKLLAAGAQPQMNIAVFQRMDIDYIVSILAILKLRCAYVPISLHDPLTRIGWLLDDIKAEIILTTQNSVNESGIDPRLFTERQVVFAHELSAEQYISNERPNHADIAYIMFTSGSTGKPKGVMVTHRNVLRLVCNANYVKFSADTRILLTGSSNFDATTFEIWGSLLNGGLLNLVDKDVLLDTELLYAELTKNRINTLWLTSAFFNQIVQQSKRNIFEGLSYLLVGGDVLSPKHINAVRNDNPRLQIINGYGPTENTTFSLTMPIEKPYTRSIPIGRPINNSTAYVLDGDLNLKPISCWGMLYVGGDGVSAGYLNNPELTREKFIKNPFGPGFLYRTDDVARLLPNLTIEFKGRIDDQVKVRGFRVTLGEIEHQLSLHESIAEAIVLVNEEKNDKYLAAYYVSPAEIDAVLIKQFLSVSLPDYMIPAYYVHLTSMPLTANGKINKKLLPAVQPATSVAYEAPADEIEAQLTKIWAQLFQMDASLISVNANFFDLGGHSLKATALMNNINRAFDTSIIIKDIFTAPTIKGQASFIRMNQWATANKDYDLVEGIEIVV